MILGKAGKMLWDILVPKRVPNPGPRITREENPDLVRAKKIEEEIAKIEAISKKEAALIAKEVAEIECESKDKAEQVKKDIAIIGAKHKEKIAQIEKEISVFENKSKEKIAKIAAKTERERAEAELKKIKKIKEAELERLEFDKNCEIAKTIVNAQADIFRMNAIVEMQKALTYIAQKRIEIIGTCSLQIEQEMVSFYDSIDKEIEKSNHEYIIHTSREYTAELKKYEPDSPEYQYYFNLINQDAIRQMQHIADQQAALGKRHQTLLEGIQANTGIILAGCSMNISNVLNNLSLNNELSLDDMSKYSTLPDDSDEKPAIPDNSAGRMALPDNGSKKPKKDKDKKDSKKKDKDKKGSKKK